MAWEWSPKVLTTNPYPSHVSHNFALLLWKFLSIPAALRLFTSVTCGRWDRECSKGEQSEEYVLSVGWNMYVKSISKWKVCSSTLSKEQPIEWLCHQWTQIIAVRHLAKSTYYYRTSQILRLSTFVLLLPSSNWLQLKVNLVQMQIYGSWQHQLITQRRDSKTNN